MIFATRYDRHAKDNRRAVAVTTSAPVCTSARDFFGLQSRMFLSALLRTYLEKVVLTPTELLHIHKEVQRLSGTGKLLQTAIDTVAKRQIRQTGQPLAQRRDELQAFIHQIETQTARVDDLKLPPLEQSFSAVLQNVKDIKAETPEYLAMAVLARDLAQNRNWFAKLARLIDLVDAEPPGGNATLLLDTVIADVLGANILQELLGWHLSLGGAITAMLDLAVGTFKPSDTDHADLTRRLNELIQAGRLPGCQNMLIDRAVRHLRSPAPLYKTDPSQEMDEYQRILARFLVPGAILSGPRAAEALTVRGARMTGQKGADGRRAAIGATVEALPDKARGVMYLAELSHSSVGAAHIDDIVPLLDDVFSARVIDELCRQSMPVQDQMVTATGAYHAAAGSALPDALRKKVTSHIDGVLERYIVDEQIIERLDNPDAPVRERAERLVKFCNAGVLPEGKAMNRARQRIVQILKQPDFDKNFIAGISNPKEAERALRDFYGLLKKAKIA